jgi:penicillin-binding protein 1C
MLPSEITAPTSTASSAPQSQPPRRRLLRYLKYSLLGGLALLLLGIVTVAFLVFAFPYSKDSLSPDRGGPLIITDRFGVVLRTVPAHNGRPGRAAWVTLDQIPSHAVLALLVSEDEFFYTHIGVDWRGIARAAWLNVKEGRVGYGGSTITMQLMRMIHSEGEARTFYNKAKEAIYALRLERAVDKNFIIEQYLNLACFGNAAYGIEAAAQLYFGKSAASLSVAEATLLMVIPRAPVRYSPFKNLTEVLKRRDHIFGLLVDKSMMTQEEADRAKAQTLDISPHTQPFKAAHFTDWALQNLSQEARLRGGVVRTSIDLRLQERLEERTNEHVASLEWKSLQQAGVVVLDTKTGEVLAMVGSVEYEAEELNITTRLRHPGSALKPFVYALALENGETPASIAMDIIDVPSEYKPEKKSQKEHGPVRYRESLAGSYNLAAVHVLEKVGIGPLLTKLERAGLGPFEQDASDYGLRLALGSAKVRLVDLAAAYGFLGRNGTVTKPQPILSIEFYDGSTWYPMVPTSSKVFSPEVSWLVMDMLSDPEARRKTFGQELPIDDMPFEIALKTGTSRGFSDTVAVGVTSEITVAAWGGNFDGTSTQGLLAMKAAAPLVRAGFMLVSNGRKLTLPEKPTKIVSRDVCARSGKVPTLLCHDKKREHFVSGHEPNIPCDWHIMEGDQLITRYPPVAEGWLQRQ